MIAPTTVTKAETFLWYQATPRLQLGVAHLWEQNAFRWLASYQLSPETQTLPSLSASAGVQGIGTGNPGYSLTAEKNWRSESGTANVFVGIGFRANESHSHGLIGAKWTDRSRLTIGLQHDGHQTHPFITYAQGNAFGGLYLIGGKSPALMLGCRF